MASRDHVSSAFAPDLEEIRSWLGRMIAALRFAELVTAMLALVGRMRDLNTELVVQLAHLRRARPRSESLRRLEGQLVLPIEGLLVPSAPKLQDDSGRPTTRGRAGASALAAVHRRRTCRACPCSTASPRSCASARSAAR